MPSILIVDDEANILSSLAGALGREGYQVEGAATLAEAREKLREAFDFALLDVWLPVGSGLDLLAEITSGAPGTVVVMMSGHATLEAAIRATRLGAYDFLEKPLSLERLLMVLQNAGAARALAAENQRLREAWASPIVGRSAPVEKLLGEIALAGDSDARVLIEGENGTGKELVARALHAAGRRRAMPFVAVNCSAIPEELVESELFGHERGAFTGATQSRRGRFEEAQCGTLFLDEIADLSPRAQTKLLRVLQEGDFTRVGGSRVIHADVRVIAASNRGLAAEVRAGRFREDLYYRVAVIPIVVPPLRERRDDVPLLVEHFTVRLCRETGQRPKRFAPEALDALRSHDFPGNVRELRNVIERLVIMHRGVEIGADAVRAALPPGAGAARSASDGSWGAAPAPERLSDAVHAAERSAIEAALEATGGNVARAAARLGLERSHLYKKMKALGLRGDGA
jgi:two-component system nitrogen regulation response regulator NtrX